MGKDNLAQTVWSNLMLGWKRCRGTEKDQVGVGVCARVTPYTPSKKKRKWMRILLISLTMAGSQGWQARGCLFPLALLLQMSSSHCKSWPGGESEINRALKLFTIILHHLLPNPPICHYHVLVSLKNETHSCLTLCDSMDCPMEFPRPEHWSG